MISLLLLTLAPLSATPQDLVPIDQHLSLYDVADLSPPPEDAAELGQCLAAANLEPELAQEVLALVRSRRSSEQLVALLREWVPLPPEASIELIGGSTLAANLSATEHTALQEFLNAQRQCAPFYELELRLIQAPRGSAAQFSAFPDEGQLLDGLQAELLMDMAKKAPDMLETITAPRLTVFARQRAQVSVINQESYIADHELQQDPESGTMIVDPVIEVVQEGFVADLRPVPLAEQRIGLSLSVSLSELQRPIPTFETVLVPNTAPVTIQLPELRKARVDTRLTLADRASFVLACPPLREGQPLFLWGQARSVESLEVLDADAR
jgi:hypothetical protein